MNLSGRYVIDASSILEKTYMLVCVFLGSKEIFRLSNEEHKAPVYILQSQFFEGKISSLLIEIATSLRILDDQFKAMDKNEPYYKNYKEALEQIDMDTIALFNNGGINLRWIYNKIIHSESFSLHKREGIEAHETDYGYKGGMADQKEIVWHHFGSHVKLAGKNREKKDDKWTDVPWHVLLNIVEFANAVYIVSNAIINTKK